MDTHNKKHGLSYIFLVAILVIFTNHSCPTVYGGNGADLKLKSMVEEVKDQLPYSSRSDG